MIERWKDIEGFPGYQISNCGRIRTFWKRRHYPSGYGSYSYISETPTIMSQSNDGNGYMKVMLYSRVIGRRVCKKVHRLVAEAFIPNPFGYDTVDHIRSGAEGKLDNSTSNLRWISRRDNIRKAYLDGMCDDRIRAQNVDIIAIDLWTGFERYFPSIKEAAEVLNIDRSTISHVLRGDLERVRHYTFEYAGREERMLYANYDEYDQYVSWL